MVFGVPFHSPLQRNSSSEGSESNTELTLSMFDKNMSDGIVGGIACGLLQEECAQNGNGPAIHGKLQQHMTWPGGTASGFVGYQHNSARKRRLVIFDKLGKEPAIAVSWTPNNRPTHPKWSVTHLRFL